METKVENCTSCGTRLVGTGNTVFQCPECAEGVIGRCFQCRDQSVKYHCPKCGKSGP